MTKAACFFFFFFFNALQMCMYYHARHTHTCNKKGQVTRSRKQVPAPDFIVFYVCIYIHTVSCLLLYHLLLYTDRFVQGFTPLFGKALLRYAFCRYWHDFRLASNLMIERNMSPCSSRGQTPKTNGMQVRTTPVRKPWSSSSEFLGKAQLISGGRWVTPRFSSVLVMRAP